MYACDMHALMPIDDRVISIGSERQIPNSDHEEADTHIMLHVNDSLERGFQEIMICTVDTDVDTDVVVILIGKLHNIVDN